MIVYISSHDKSLAKDMAERMAQDGIPASSTWHVGEVKRTAEYTEADRAEIARRNTGQIAMSDALVLIAADDKVPGGKFVEAGFALAIGMPVAILGRRENILLWHERVRAFETPDQVVQFLKDCEAAEED